MSPHLSITDEITDTCEQFNHALAAYARKDYLTAFNIFNLLAEQGHSAAQFNLSSMYFFGQGIEQDWVKADEWFKRAAAQGSAEAQYRIARQEKEKNMKKHWYEKAAEQGHADAECELGMLYFFEKNYMNARHYLELSAMKENRQAQNYLAVMHHNGLGVPRNCAKARFWYQQAAKGLSKARKALRELQESGC